MCGIAIFSEDSRRKRIRHRVNGPLSLFFNARKLKLQPLKSLFVNKSRVKHVSRGPAHRIRCDAEKGSVAADNERGIFRKELLYSRGTALVACLPL